MLYDKPYSFSIDSAKPNAGFLLSKEIELLFSQKLFNQDLIILCIGTDRSTGDCLGPLIGHKLQKNYIIKNAVVLGTLSDPVHAKNIESVVDDIYKNFNNPFIVAIDACLGKCENIGKINLAEKPLFPGAGVNKNLKPVGDISITGIVNMSGFMEYVVLQNTRLSLVMKIADIISFAIYVGIKNSFKNNVIQNNSLYVKDYI